MAARFQKRFSILSRARLLSFRRPSRMAALALVATTALAACGGPRTVTQPVEGGFVGSVAADEPRAAQIAHDVLARGGNAADAATALGLALSVTLPSRASLGSGGACLAWRPGDATGQAFVFVPPAGAGNAAGADRPAAVPMLARGLFLLQLRYGSVDLNGLFLPARDLALHGVPVSGLLASDLAVVQNALLADEKARAIFTKSDGSVLGTDDLLVQTRLAGALERMRTAGVGDLYGGSLGQVFVTGANTAGGALDIQDLRSALATVQTPLTARAGGVDLSFLPPPADGGLGMALLYLAGGQGVRAEQVVAGWRSQHGGKTMNVADAQALLDSGHAPAGGGLAALPASTSYVVTDRTGETVACALSMNNLFGTGRIAGSTGIVLAASPARRPQPLLAAGIAHVGTQQFRAAAAASGQNVAADTAAIALHSAVAGVRPEVTQGVGRANSVSCPAGLPGNAQSCFAWTDPRGTGLALPVGH
ncbi:gamma-glutamyltransferase [Acetobacter vaccinii]